MIRTMFMRVVEYKTDLGQHLIRVCKKQESIGDACRGLGHDTVKLFKFIAQPHRTKDHKEAVRFVKKGTAEYNAGRYEQAVYYFKRAIQEDKHYARAFTYLGNALYKRGLQHEAITAWSAAIDANPNSDAAKMAEDKLRRLNIDRDNVITSFD